MKKLIHKLFGFELSKYTWYRRWQGGEWTMVYVEAINQDIWVKDYKGVAQAKTVMKENW